MKRCPTCDKTFDDNMRFCQADGTPLVEDAPVDPYKTMIARPGDFAAAKSSSQSDDVLDLPSANDPAKTMYASEDEIRREMSAHDEQVIDIPPLVEPEAPSFTEPTPPPSPFSTPDLGGMTVPPIPSPFDPKPSTFEPPTPSFDEPKPYAYDDSPSPSFAEPEPIRQEPVFNPFDQPTSAMDQAGWTPPPAPDSGWQNQQIGQNTPFQPPVVGVGNQNKTLAIVSLILGILGLTICCGGVLPSLIAVVTGVMARNNAKKNPKEYGGEGLAMAGIVTGAIGLVGGVIILVFWFLGAFASALGNM